MPINQPSEKVLIRTQFVLVLIFGFLMGITVSNYQHDSFLEKALVEASEIEKDLLKLNAILEQSLLDISEANTIKNIRAESEWRYFTRNLKLTNNYKVKK